MDEIDAMHNSEDDARCEVGGNEISVGDCDDVVSGDEIEDIEVGKEFDSLDDCYNFYRNYGKQKGFGVFKRDSKRGDDGVERWVTYNVSQVVQSQINVSGGLTGLLLNYVQNPSQESQNFGMSFSGHNEDHHGETGD